MGGTKIIHKDSHYVYNGLTIAPSYAGMVMRVLGNGPTVKLALGKFDTPVKEVVPAQDLATGWLSPYGLPTV